MQRFVVVLSLLSLIALGTLGCQLSSNDSARADAPPGKTTRPMPATITHDHTPPPRTPQN